MFFVCLRVWEVENVRRNYLHESGNKEHVVGVLIEELPVVFSTNEQEGDIDGCEVWDRKSRSACLKKLYVSL